jgi:hypothetical protein
MDKTTRVVVLGLGVVVFGLYALWMVGHVIALLHERKQCGEYLDASWQTAEIAACEQRWDSDRSMTREEKDEGKKACRNVPQAAEAVNKVTAECKAAAWRAFFLHPDPPTPLPTQ